MMFEVTHKTHYQYTHPVARSQHRVHLVPRSDGRQTVIRHSMLIEPAPFMRNDSIDALGNHVSILDIEEPHREFVLNARSAIRTFKPVAFDFAQTTPWDALDETLYPPGERIDIDVVQNRCASRLTGATLAIRDYAASSFLPGRPVLEAVFDLTRRVYREFTFDSTATDISTPIAQVLKTRRGVCQDFAHLTLAALRAHGIPARYMSGYVLTHPPPGQPKLTGSDASHAWIAVWAPETKWREFDPTNGLAVGDEHVLVAHGRDYADVCPISGVIVGGGDHTVSVSVDVAQVPER